MEIKRERNEVILFIIAITLILITISYLVGEHVSMQDLKDLKETINSYGPWVPLILLVMIIITSSIGFVFMIPVAIAALMLNGFSAFIISVLGLTCGAMINFYFCRYIGRDYVERKFIHRIKKLELYDKRLEKNGFVTILFLRFIQLIPFELVNVAGGLSRIRGRSFFLATLIGVLPGTILAIYFINTTENLWSTQFFFASILFILFAITPLISKKIRRVAFNLR